MELHLKVGITHIAITPASEGGTVWLQKVTDTEYGAAPGPRQETKE